MIVLDFALTVRPPRREPGRALEQATGGLYHAHEVDLAPPDDATVERVLDRLREWSPGR